MNTDDPVAPQAAVPPPGAPAYGADKDQLRALFASWGEPRYRADQLWAALYRPVNDWAAMTTLPAAVRVRLADALRLRTVAPVAATTSDDGLSTKLLLRLADDQLVETVLMYAPDPADEDTSGDSEASATSTRHTVCLSTQAGCAMGCVFCATGQMGLVRDLTVSECVEQVVACQRTLAGMGRVDHIVFMGMGEPLANWATTWACVERLHDPTAFGIGARRITISTVGLPEGIRRLAAAPIPVRLAVSLHAPDDELRDALVPINEIHRLDDVLAACRVYQEARRRRITFEYVLIDRVNDRPRQAAALAVRLAGLNAHVNLIPLNPTAGSALAPSPIHRAEAFQRVLVDAGIPATLRVRRGIDIQAGCGQLRSRASEGRLGRGLGAPMALYA